MVSRRGTCSFHRRASPFPQADRKLRALRHVLYAHYEKAPDNPKIEQLAFWQDALAVELKFFQ